MRIEGFFPRKDAKEREIFKKFLKIILFFAPFRVFRGGKNKRFDNQQLGLIKTVIIFNLAH